MEQIEQETLDNYINGNTGSLERYELIQLIRFFESKAREYSGNSSIIYER